MLALIMEKQLGYFSKGFMFDQFHCFEANPINFDVLKKY